MCRKVDIGNMRDSKPWVKSEERSTWNCVCVYLCATSLYETGARNFKC